ncbi:hypothetical protein [Gracilibacillus boraciitolerans]|nr:hypothetical protein [Gracilibacillus boraciitolerans]
MDDELHGEIVDNNSVKDLPPLFNMVLVVVQVNRVLKWIQKKTVFISV